MENKITKTLAMISLMATPIKAMESDIEEAANLSAVENIMNGVTKTLNFDSSKVILVTDIDGTLIHGIGPECGGEGYLEWNKLFNTTYSDLKFKRNKGEDYSVILEGYTKMLTAPGLPKYMESISDNMKIKCIALTAKFNINLGGKIGMSHTIYRKELKEYGYNFEKDWIGLKAMKFITPDKKPSYKDPDYADGIIYKGAGRSKEYAFYRFLKYSGYISEDGKGEKVDNLTKVIFMDNQLCNIKSMRDYVKTKLGIGFKGIHYTAAAQLPKIPYDKESEQERLNTLKTTRKWEPRLVEALSAYDQGEWKIKNAITSRIELEMSKVDSDNTFSSDSPQGSTETNSDSSLDTLKHNP